MRVTIAPSTEDGIDAGQHTASAEYPDDALPVMGAVELFAAALRAYGAREEAIQDAFSTFLIRHEPVETENTAHC